MTVLEQLEALNRVAVYRKHEDDANAPDEDMANVIGFALLMLGPKKRHCRMILWGGFGRDIKDIRDLRYLAKRLPMGGIEGYLGCHMGICRGIDGPIWVLCLENIDTEARVKLLWRIRFFSMEPGYYLIPSRREQRYGAEVTVVNWQALDYGTVWDSKGNAVTSGARRLARL